jgi:hypothetical protein
MKRQHSHYHKEGGDECANTANDSLLIMSEWAEWNRMEE